MSKLCTQCNLNKHKTSFNKNSRNSDGLKSWCKECCNRKNLEWRDKKPEQYRETAKLASKRWSDKNPEKRKAAHKAWYEANKEKHAGLCKSWREDNSEKHKEYQREYMKARYHKNKTNKGA